LVRPSTVTAVTTTRASDIAPPPDLRCQRCLATPVNYVLKPDTSATAARTDGHHVPIGSSDRKGNGCLTVDSPVYFGSLESVDFPLAERDGSVRQSRVDEIGPRREVPMRRTLVLLASVMVMVSQFGVVAAHAAPPVSWAGEVLVGGTSDDWEPSIAADPGAPYVYLMYNRYGGAKACQHCPSPSMMIQVSSNGGQSWGAENFICTCSGVPAQYDPVLRVASTGVVFASWMNNSTIVFSRSSNHGVTWSTPLAISGKSWADKDWMGISNNGADVYVAYESRSNYMITSSHDSGATWSTPIKVNSDTSHYRYANGFEVLSNGTAVLSDSSYPNGSGKASGPVEIEVWRSTNGGGSWSRVVIDTVSTGVDFFTSSTTTIASDATGALVVEYSGATAVGSNGHMYSRRSVDGGLTWSARTELTPVGGSGNASFPALTGTGTGLFYADWQEGRSGSWNTYERSSTDGGMTWSAEARLSDATSGAPYKTAAGYGSAYGDYGAIDVTNLGKAIAAWGEGVDPTTGPGGIWVNRQT
jgi:hypothetical protein